MLSFGGEGYLELYDDGHHVTFCYLYDEFDFLGDGYRAQFDLSNCHVIFCSVFAFHHFNGEYGQFYLYDDVNHHDAFCYLDCEYGQLKLYDGVHHHAAFGYFYGEYGQLYLYDDDDQHVNFDFTDGEYG